LNTPGNRDCLVNKFRRRVIGTLFIKLQLILREWPDVVVNRMLLRRESPGIAALQGVNGVLSGGILS
jgi:hypothetical protein